MLAPNNLYVTETCRNIFRPKCLGTEAEILIQQAVKFYKYTFKNLPDFVLAGWQVTPMISIYGATSMTSHPGRLFSQDVMNGLVILCLGCLSLSTHKLGGGPILSHTSLGCPRGTHKSLAVPILILHFLQTFPSALIHFVLKSDRPLRIPTARRRQDILLVFV